MQNGPCECQRNINKVKNQVLITNHNTNRFVIENILGQNFILNGDSVDIFILNLCKKTPNCRS